MRSRPRLAALTVLAAAVLLGAGAGEAVLRVVGPFQRAGKTPDHVLWRPDPAIGFAPAANLDAEVFTSEWLTRVRTDRFGFRLAADATNARDPGDGPMLMFLGDSQTMGVQVPAESTFTELVGGELARRGLIWRAVNAGCNGFNTVQAYLFFEQVFQQGVRPQVVVLYATNNDLSEDVAGLPYGRYTILENGLIARRPPDPSAIDRLASAKAMAAPRPGFWLRHSALIRHAWYTYRILPRSIYVAQWVKGSYLRDALDPSSRHAWAAAGAAVRSLRHLVASYGGTLVVAVHPDPVEWSDTYYARLQRAVPELSDRIDRMKIQRGFRRLASEAGVPFIEMLDGFPNASLGDFRFSLDPHANASGHRIIAAQLLKGLERAGVLRGE